MLSADELRAVSGDVGLQEDAPGLSMITVSGIMKLLGRIESKIHIVLKRYEEGNTRREDLKAMVEKLNASINDYKRIYDMIEFNNLDDSHE